MFLLTTALNDFIDEQNDVILLGEWCKTNTTKDYQVMNYIWDHHKKVTNAMKKCEYYYEFFLDILTKELNQIHNVDNSQQYYKILLGEWLYHYININYDRFLTIYFFYRKYGNFDTILLDEQQYIIPFDYKDFITITQTDEYNLQIYSKVLSFLFPKKKFKTKCINNKIEKKLIKIFRKESLKSKFLRKVSSILSFAQNDKIVFCEVNFGDRSLISMLKLLIKSNFKIIFDNFNYIEKIQIADDTTRRDTINIYTTNVFKKYIFKNILQDIPSIYLSNYQQFKDDTLKKITFVPRVFYTSTALYGNNEVKFFLAENYKNIQIISHQHGGLYGWLSYLWGENYEREIANYFLTSGWKEDEKTIPFGLPMLIKKNILNNSNVTFITTNASKYLLRFVHYPMSSIYLKSFFIDMELFFKHLHRYVIDEKFIIRPYHTKISLNMINKIIKSNNYNTRIDINNKMSKVIQNSKLLIFDHLGTTILETLFLNKPTVIFIDLQTYKFRDSFVSMVEELIYCKILHTSPISASKHINEIFDDVEAWWFSDIVQKTRWKFVNKYAKSNKNWEEQLISLFDQIMSNKDLILK